MHASLPLQSLELKYCERCGGLWLRASGAAAVYCPPCTSEMAALPPARGIYAPSPGPQRRPEIETAVLPPATDLQATGRCL